MLCFIIILSIVHGIQSNEVKIGLTATKGETSNLLKFIFPVIYESTHTRIRLEGRLLENINDPFGVEEHFHIAMNMKPEKLFRVNVFIAGRKEAELLFEYEPINNISLGLNINEKKNALNNELVFNIGRNIKNYTSKFYVLDNFKYSIVDRLYISSDFKLDMNIFKYTASDIEKIQLNTTTGFASNVEINKTNLKLSFY